MTRYHIAPALFAAPVLHRNGIALKRARGDTVTRKEHELCGGFRVFTEILSRRRRDTGGLFRPWFPGSTYWPVEAIFDAD